jgi:3-oxoacyl-[acyl-carrier-protein] synthase II
VTTPGLWVTGCGLVTALGAGVEATWTRLVRGERAIGPVDVFDTRDHRSRVGAQVRAPLGGEGGDDPSWSRTTAMALLAAGEASRNAGWTDGFGGARARAGLVVGGTVGGMFETEALLARFHAEPGSREVLSRMLSHPLTATTDRLEAQLGPFQRVRTLSSACSGGANALVVAAIWLLSGEVDVVLAGASDGLCRLTFSGFNALGALDPEPCRPFDARRKGLSLGEGAGFVVLEREQTACARGATPLVELRGWAIGSEAHHITNPEATGATPARLLRAAIARAGLGPGDIGYVNAHGTGTPLNDPMETRAIREALGDAADHALVSSTKGQIGHTLGAAGAIEAVVTALAIARKAVPPTGGLDVPDPECALVHVMGEAQRHDVRAAVSSSFGFGGMDAVLVLAEPGAFPLGAAAMRGARSVVVTGAAAVTGPEVDAGGQLDPARARRLDRAARMGTVAAARATRGAGAEAPADRAGIVLGSAFGNVDGSAAYMHRLSTKGPRFASPADFPNLVPSSPVGHASIYLGLRGPVLAVADLAASGEAAVAAAHELLIAGEADLVVAGAFEEASDIVERVLVALFTEAHAGRAPRSEGGGAIVLEAEDAARVRGASILARIERILQWRGAAKLDVRAPRDPGRARVVVHARGAGAALVAGTAWESCEAVAAADEAGDHEALGGNAASLAAELVGRGKVDEALALCAEKGRKYAILMVRP